MSFFWGEHFISKPCRRVTAELVVDEALDGMHSCRGGKGRGDEELGKYCNNPGLRK
jgi:hypothetical protein